MKKMIIAMTLCASFSVLAADPVPSASVNLKFTGTLTQPTCTASFVGTAGTDIAFGNINASDIVGKTQESIITAPGTKNVSLNLTNCGGGITQVKVNFVGTSTSGAGFIRKAVNFRNGTAESGLGFALFANTSGTAPGDALYVSSDKANEPTVLALSSLTKSGETYSWPLFAKMVVVRNELLATSAAVNSNSAGKDLTAQAYANIVYE